MTDYPVKVRWTGDARSKFLTRRLTPAVEDAELPNSITDVCSRQKTNIVIQDKQEHEIVTDQLREFINYDCHPDLGLEWATKAKQDSAKRVLNELTD